MKFVWLISRLNSRFESKLKFTFTIDQIKYIQKEIEEIKNNISKLN